MTATRAWARLGPGVVSLGLFVAGCANVDGNSGVVAPTTYDSGAVQDTFVATDTGGGQADTGSTTPDTTTAADTTKVEDTGVPPGTCGGACDIGYDPKRSCQCNKDCLKFGNCCADYGQLCLPGEMTCQGRCDAALDVTKPCQCSWDCPKFGSCCPDFVATCHGGEALDWFQAPTGKCTKTTDWVKVKFIPDGDTLHLEQQDAKGNDIAVRFLLVDTPEVTSNDCYAVDAKKYTFSAVQKSNNLVCLVKETKSDDKDIYGRLLRYVYVKDPSQTKPVELNLRLLRLGLARVLYPFAKGNPYEKLALLTMAKAKEDNLGGWKSCGWVKPK